MIDLAAIALTLMLVATPAVKRAGGYEITLRPPEGGLCSGDEQQLEFRIVDSETVDPLMGPAPVIRARVRASIDMPSMPSMPKFEAIAHYEAVPGDYGVHPVFAHGGEYRLRLDIAPPEGDGFSVEFPLDVGDACAGRAKTDPQWKIELQSQPKSPRAGEPAELRITVRHRDQPRLAHAAFDIAHEKRMHLIVVRKDLAFFAHLHPDMSESGVFALRYVFPSTGEYHLFADVAPAGAGSQVLMTKIKVGGRSIEPPPSDARGVSIALPEGAPAGRTVRVVARVTGGSIEKYLGAMGHLFLIHGDGVTFVHSHPDERESAGAPDGVVPFLARFPKPGRYRGWAQFQRHGALLTADLAVEASLR